MSQLIAALAGALIVGGLVVALTGLRRTTVPRKSWRRFTAGSLRTGPGRSGGSRGDVWRWRWYIAAGAGVTGWLVTGWPVVGLIAAASVLGLPVLLGTAKVQSRAIGRVEALEEWTRRLSDILIAGIGLEQAITSTLRICPPPIAGEVGGLAARFAARWSTEDALRAFADDLDDASGDLVVSALILNSRRRGPGIARILVAVADAVAEDVSVRRKIEAERAKPRATAKAITIITFAVVGVGALNGTYLEPYGDPLGQLVLALITVAFIGCLAWMRALTVSPPAPRFIARQPAAVSVVGEVAGR